MGIVKSSPDRREFFVYTLLCRDGDGPLYVKFGRTTRPTVRLSELRHGSPIPARIYAFLHVPTEVTQKRVERALHKQFADRKTKGEWFRFCPKQDKRAFNDGCLQVFQDLKLQGTMWQKVNIEALDQVERQRKAVFLQSKQGRRVAAMQRAQRRLS